MTNTNAQAAVAVAFEGVKMHHATRKAAAKLQALLQAEYPAIRLVAQTANDGEAEQLTAWQVLWAEAADTADVDAVEIYHGDKLPSIADLVDACDEAGVDMEHQHEDEDEPKASGSVVAETYRARYREVSSNGQTCGDWLAERLVDDTHGVDGFNPDDFTAILVANDVDMRAKWASLPTSGQRGWVGRYRMNGRQVLEKLVALRGIYVDGVGTEVTPPADWLEAMRSKHAVWIGKQRKAEEAAEAAARTAVEG